MTKKILSLGFLALLLAASVASAQRSSERRSTPIELGIDADLAFILDDPHTTLLALPAPIFRVGFIVSDKLELEPRLAITSAHVSGLGSFTDYTFELGVLYQPAGDRVGRGLYLRPFLGVSGSSDSEAGNNNSGYAGGGLGIKLPFADRRLAARMEAAYEHGFESNGTNALALIFGLSFFTR
jgi:hypothetical protein